MRRTLGAVLVVALVACSGCASLFGDAGVGDSRLTYDVPPTTERTETTSAGADIDTDSKEDPPSFGPETVADHVVALDGRAVQVRRKVTVRSSNGRLVSEHGVEAWVAANRSRYRLAVVDRDDSNVPTRFDVFSPGSAGPTVRASGLGPDRTVRRLDGDRVAVVASDQVLYWSQTFERSLRRYLGAAESVRVLERSPDAYTVTARLGPEAVASTRQVRDVRTATLTATVEDGLLGRVRVEYDARVDGRQRTVVDSLVYAAVGNVSVRTPRWVPDAAGIKNVTGTETIDTGEGGPETDEPNHTPS